jgi:xanthine dehydrogenase YagS FAD-binding subunit
LKPNEILTAIHIPLSGLNNSVYEIRHRHGLDWPYATAAVAFKLSGSKASDVRIVLGHVAPTPWLASKAGKSLEGAEVTMSSAAHCAQSATQGAKTLSGNAYKVPMVKTSVKRAILIAAGIQMKG